MTPKFDAPRTRKVILARPVFVSGRDLPRGGICLFREGEEVTAQTDNGAEWYLLGSYRGKSIKVATIL